MISNFLRAFLNSIIFCIYSYICGYVLFEHGYYNKKSLIIGNLEYIILALLILLALDGIVANVLGCIAFCLYFKRVFNKDGILSAYAGMVTQSLRLLPKLLFLVLNPKYNYEICSYKSISCIDLFVNICFVIVGLILLFVFKKQLKHLRDLFLINHRRLYIFIFVLVLEIILITLVRLEFIVIDINFILDCFLCIILISFMSCYFYDNYKVYNMSNHYREMAEYTHLNDRLINDYRIKLHDNNNHLLAIKSMTKDKKVINYINDLVDFEDIDSDSYLNELKLIPSLSVRIFINYKLFKLKEIGTTIELVVSDDLKELPEEDLPNAYTIIGIIMDNMIEYLSTIDEKLASVVIYMRDNKIVAEFVNNFYGNIKLNDLYELGYSTKGSGRGIGLPIVKRIIDSNPRYDLETEVIDNYFVQRVMVDLDK